MRTSPPVAKTHVRKDIGMTVKRYRKVGLTTNVNQTGVTLTSVAVVISTTGVRMCSPNLRSREDVNCIQTVSISDLIQQGGRSGRVAPGKHVIVASEEQVQRQFRGPSTPELLNADIAPLLSVCKKVGGAVPVKTSTGNNFPRKYQRFPRNYTSTGAKFSCNICPSVLVLVIFQLRLKITRFVGERQKSPPQPQRIARFWCTQDRPLIREAASRKPLLPLALVQDAVRENSMPQYLHVACAQCSHGTPSATSNGPKNKASIGRCLSTVRPVFPVLVFQLSKQQNRTRTTSSTVRGTPPNRTRTKKFPLKKLRDGCFVGWVLN